MKVSELVEFLKTVPQDLDVCLFYDYCVTWDLTKDQIAQVTNSPDQWHRDMYWSDGLWFCCHGKDEMKYLAEQNSKHATTILFSEKDNEAPQF